MDTIISQRLNALRTWLINNNYDAVIIPHEDEFLGEYVPPNNERLHWATGFTGSAGVAVITRYNAAIFVDGRYTVQVKNQVPQTLFEYCHLTEQPYLEWLNTHSEGLSAIAYDPRMHTISWLKSATQTLNNELHLIELTQNPVDICWTDRPQTQLSKMRLLDLDVSGQSSEGKRKHIGDIIASKSADAAIITQLDSICWLLNIRGLDVPRLPVLLSHAIIHADSSVDFFLSADRVCQGFEEHVGDKVTVIDPRQMNAHLQVLSGKKVLLDPNSSNAWFKIKLEELGISIVENADPCIMVKAEKNPVEISGMRSCHVRDGVSMVKFLCWLDNEVDNGRLNDEAILSDQLQGFREEDETLVDLSFDTISASGSNAAMCHYNHNNQESPSRLVKDSLYLVDSGGQYSTGTTDITRTVAIGNPSHEMKTLFTLVLKGHISLSCARFPLGTTGLQLDILARQYLWSHGYDYDHGTGHGVGHFLSVHEGPQSISKKPNSVALIPGMIVSNEPGYYRAEKFGIRIENLVLVVNKESQGDFNVIGFEPLTLCPIDIRNIEVNLLTKSELRWLNQYHEKVRTTLSPRLDSRHRQWLKQATRALSHS